LSPIPLRRWLRNSVLRAQRPAALLSLLFSVCQAFNLDVDSPFVYDGPAGSYFGFAVDFFVPDTKTVGLLVGAPKANSSQPEIVEGGVVYKCNWGKNQACQPITFDTQGDRVWKDDPIEFKSHQWFGASVRSKNDMILACAPMYQWRTLVKPEREPVGTCYLQNRGRTVEYAPCRT
uniref:Uncharacterized protein n=1 Tax=Latimeria chalumnae TaxID=7897 RepID=H2ZTB2_LATCH